MSQGDQHIENQNGAAFRSDLNAELKALASNSSGVTTPVTRYAYQFWADTTNGLLKQRNAANTAWLVRSTLVESMVVARTSNVIFTESDRGRWFVWNGTFTQTIDALVTLDEGWHVYYRNDGVGVVTVDPSGAELIDGAATLNLAAGDSGIIFRDATSFKTIRGLTQSAVSITGGTITGITDLAVADGGTGASTAAAARTNLLVPAADGAGAHSGSGPWNINIAGSSGAVNGISGWSYADSGAASPSYLWATGGSTAAQFLVQPQFLNVGHANTATTASNGLVGIHAGGTVGGTGAGNALTGGVAGPFLAGITVDATGRVTAMTYSDLPDSPDNSSIHPDSEIEMNDGSMKWLKDIRIGDKVRGKNGSAVVLGIWTNILAERTLYSVNGVVCTPGHLFPLKRGIWGAANPDLYYKNSHKKVRAVKGRRGMVPTCCELGGEKGTPQEAAKLVIGDEILGADGQYHAITELIEYKTSGPEKRLTSNQQVIALYLDNSKIFYADGYAVATLA